MIPKRLELFRSWLKYLCRVCVQVLGVWSTSYIPKGTRFGPLVGQVYTKDSVPADANRKYFWRVRFFCNYHLFMRTESTSEVMHTCYDTSCICV